MHKAQQWVKGQGDNKTAEYRCQPDGEHIGLATPGFQPVPDNRLPDGQGNHRIQDAGGLDNQIGDTHFVLRHHARVETEHQDDQDLRAERADREDKGVA